MSEQKTIILDPTIHNRMATMVFRPGRAIRLQADGGIDERIIQLIAGILMLVATAIVTLLIESISGSTTPGFEVQNSSAYVWTIKAIVAALLILFHYIILVFAIGFFRSWVNR